MSYPTASPESPDASSSTALAPVTRSALMLIAAADTGLAISDFVLRPLLGPDLSAALRGGLVLGAAVWVTAAVRRSARRPIALPPEGSEAAPSRPADTLAACLAGLGAAGGEAPATLAVHVATPLVEVFWAGPPPEPIPPWRASDTGWVWEATSDQLAHPVSAAPPWLAAIVELGATPTGHLWLNLAAFRVVALVGEPDEVTRQVGQVVTTLRRRAGPGLLDVLVLGDGGSPDAPASEPAALDDVRAALWRRAARRHAPATRRRRRHDPPLPTPLVIVAAADRAKLERLIPSVRCDPAATIIVVGEAPADLRLTCRAGQIWVPFLGDLAVVANPRFGAPDSDPPVPTPQPTEPREPEPVLAVTSAPAVGRPSVEVRVLGPVEAHGASQPVTGKSLELVAYLACHPDGVNDDRIRAALWPERSPSAKTWANRVSVARKALGADPDGTPRLSRFRQHVGRLSRSVRTDLDMLAAALECLSDVPDPSAVDGLAAALERVRGRPFDVPTGYDWAYTELHVAHAERIIVDAAHRLAALSLDAGDWKQALWASERGLLACPESEVLFQDRMRGYEIAGDRRGLAATMRDLLRTIGAIDPDAAPHPDTVELYEQLHDTALRRREGASTPTK